MDITSLARVDGKIGATTLIRAFFPGVTLADMKALDENERAQLGTAIAKQEQVPFEECKFAPVEY